MTQLLVIKDWIRDFYRKYYKFILPVLRFVAAYLVFTMINKEIGYSQKLQSSTVLLAMSAVSAVMPSSVMVLLAGVMVLVHIFAASQMLSLVYLLIIAILYFLFARFVPRYGWVVLAIPVTYALRIPYAVPLVLGLTANPISAMAAGCGVAVHYLLQLIKETALMTTGSLDMEDSLAMYTYVLKSLVTSKPMFLAILVFTLVIMIVWFVRKLRIAHAYEIATITGTVITVLLFLVGDMLLNVDGRGIMPLLFGVLVSGILAYVVQFFRFILDYSVIENVQFDDDDYYYYVKAVPKLKVTTPEVSVKTFTANRQTRGVVTEPVEEPEEPDQEELFLAGEEYYEYLPEQEQEQEQE